MITKDIPCKPNCADRNGTCHATCIKYKEYKEKRDIEKAKIDKQRQSESDFIAHRHTTSEKIYKDRHTVNKALISRKRG